MTDKNPYEDMLMLPHHRSKKHPHMPREDRAAQFAPFAALTGHSDAVEETARLTEEEWELSDNQREQLDNKLTGILQEGDAFPKLKITYFVPDDKKSGGKYCTLKGVLLKIDRNRKEICLQGMDAIPFERVTEIDKWEEEES